MIEREAQFRLMAYMDGELSEREAAEVREWLSHERETQALLSELQATARAFSGHEAGLKLPETREFYWSKIQREIERLERTPEAAGSTSLWSWLMAHWVPAGGVALLSCLLALLMLSPGRATGNQLAELEMTSDDMGAYTYRDQQQRMTMVWFYDRGNDSQFTEESSLASMNHDE